LIIVCDKSPKMTVSAFKNSLISDFPPEGIPIQLKSLWYDAKNDWHRAHDLADGPTDLLSARVHAYLHRKEGDAWNAEYWYRRAGEKKPDMDLEEEWEMLVLRILNKS
jgi:hypothetical protein